MQSDKQLPLFVPDFLQIPYQLLTDRELEQTDRMLYGLVYWYEHMKDGECRASNQSFAALLYTSTRVIQNSLNTLEKRGYISRDYKDSSKRNRLRIHGNISYKRVPPIGDTPKTYHPQVTKVPPTGDTRVPPIGDQIKNTNIKKKKDIVIAPQGGASIQHLIKLFEPINPTYERLFSNKTQRAALERLEKKFGADKVESCINFAVVAYGKDYAPSITNPLQLEQKLGQLVAFWKREKSRAPMLIEI